MPVITWNESSPDGADSLGQGDEAIKSLKTSVRIGLDAEHVWPSGGGDAGVHRLGSARVQYGSQSLVSSTGTDGRLFQTSNTSQLFHVGSGGTAFIGGATAISAGSFPGSAPQRHQWMMEFGVGVTNTGGAAVVAFPNSGFSGLPFMQLTPRDETAGARVNLAVLTQSSFAVNSYKTTGASASSVTFHWSSIGSRVL